MADLHWLRGLAVVVVVSVGFWAQQCARAQTTQGPGLTIRDNGLLLKAGAPYRGIGVNYFDAFARTLKDRQDTSYEAGFRVLAAHGIPFARFMCTGFWPAEMELYVKDKAEYFELLDGVVHAAQKHGIGLIPSLFWHMPTVPDLVHESCDQWGNPNSKTHEFMRTYTREVVTRYRDSPAIWGWEFGNEYNLAADLPNAKEHLPPVVPQRGTPQTRSARDILTHEMIRTAFREFAKEIRKIDRTRMICTGNSILRPPPGIRSVRARGPRTRPSNTHKCWRETIPTLWRQSRSTCMNPRRIASPRRSGRRRRRTSLSSSASSAFKGTAPRSGNNSRSYWTSSSAWRSRWPPCGCSIITGRRTGT